MYNMEIKTGFFLLTWHLQDTVCCKHMETFLKRITQFFCMINWFSRYTPLAPQKPQNRNLRVMLLLFLLDVKHDELCGPSVYCSVKLATHFNLLLLHMPWVTSEISEWRSVRSPSKHVQFKIAKMKQHKWTKQLNRGKWRKTRRVVTF